MQKPPRLQQTSRPTKLPAISLSTLNHPFLLHTRKINHLKQNMIRNKLILHYRRLASLAFRAIFECGHDSRRNNANSKLQLVSLAHRLSGRSFEAKIAHDVSVKGNVVLKAGTKAFGKVTASRANPRKSGPLTVELDSIDLNTHDPVKTNSIQPGGPPQTARQAQYGHTAGTTVVNPKTTLQFQLAAPLNL